ncbi:hypothetical protein LIER_36478 [Lithospermum erythrorhizon]|uniref:Kinetochore protein NDC80 n=1 Tax=Lithospermum erythrorhizon TaxID=34254 RepID=A0AAV3P7X1_LITER
MRGGGFRRSKDSQPADRQRHPPPPTPTATFNPWQQHHFATTQRRDSDASYASSRPSMSSLRPPADEKVNSVTTINNYLTTTFKSLPPIKPPLSIRDIEVIKHLLVRLGFHVSNKFEDDLNIFLKTLNCPVKFNKSALRAPGERRASAMLVALIHWLVQLCQYNDHLSRSSEIQPFMADNGMFNYVKDCYVFYMNGDDNSVVALDEELIGKLENQRDEMKEENQAVEEEIKALEEKLEGLKGQPSRKEQLDKEKVDLEEDVKKFQSIIEQFQQHVVMMEKAVADKQTELDVKVVENEKICVENAEIKRQVEEQGINLRDAERMKRELHAVERDINDTEAARNEWEEKAWNLNADIGNKLKELEQRVIECNQAIRRLKLGSEFQYQLNAEGSTLAELLGIDYKTTVKPTLAAAFDDVKRASVEKFEELISLKKQATESASRIDAKRSHISTLSTQIEQVEALLDLIRIETHDYTSRCSAEGRKIAEDLEAETTNMVTSERDAAEYLKVSEAKLQEAIIQTEEKVQSCARNLFAVVDSVSKFKEHVALRMSEMKANLSETAVKVADAHKYNLPVVQFEHIDDKSMLME